MTVATWQQVAVALGRPTASFNTDQQGQITWWLDGVELLIKTRLGEIGALDPMAVKYVEVESVAAKVPPPGTNGESSVTVSVDDGAVTRRWDSRVTADDVTDEWWALLTGDPESDAFTINPLGSRRQRALNSAAECW